MPALNPHVECGRVTSDLDAAGKRELRRKARRATLDALAQLGGEARREAIRDRALAVGGFTARELAAPPPAGAEHNYARLVDHNLSWALTNLKSTGAVENPSRGVWRLAGVPATSAVQPEAVSEQRLGELREMPYPRYLRTPEWRRTRSEALLRAHNCCALDATHTDGLEVHHRTYERLGAEQPADMVVLCHACHHLHHSMFGVARRGRSEPVYLEAPSADGVAAAAAATPPAKRSWLARLLAG